MKLHDRAIAVLRGVPPRQCMALFLSMQPDYHNDKWGSAMAAAFDVAGACYVRGIHVPDYRPGICGPGEPDDEYNRELLAGLHDYELECLMRFINRLLHGLRRAGKDY